MSQALVLLLFSAALANPNPNDIPPNATESPHSDVATPALDEESHPLSGDIEARLQRRINSLEARLADLETHAEPSNKLELEASPSVQFVAPGETVSHISALMTNAIIGGIVSGNATVVGGNIHILPTGIVRGDAVAIGGEINVEIGGRVLGNRAELPYGSPIVNWSLLESGAGIFAQLTRRLIFLLTFADFGGWFLSY